jgi:glycosyltransferase involved in cell wall biosynthesis
MNSTVNLRIGYLMQNGAPDLEVVSGPQLHVTAVIKGLQKLGHHVRTVATQQQRLAWSDDLQHWFAPQYGVTAAKWFRLMESVVRRTQSELQLPFVGIFDSLHYADVYTRHLNHYDLLYERHGYMGYGGVIAARRLGIPLIIELNGNIVKEIDTMPIKMSAIQRKLGRWLTFWTLLAADHVVVVSNALKHQLMASVGIPEERVSVVVNGVDLALFSRSFHGADVREQFGVGPEPIVAFVGSFQPWHGVNLLVSSFGLVQTCFPKVQLLLVGDGAGRDAVVTQIADMGLQANIKLLGRLAQDQVAAVLSIADVVVAPYPLIHGEIVGTPLKILEYMAAGKAIVASTAPLHEIITDGVTGLRVAPASASSLAQGISRLLGNEELRARLGRNASCQARQYSWEHVAEQLSEIFMAELAKRNHHSLAGATISPQK